MEESHASTSALLIFLAILLFIIIVDIFHSRNNSNIPTTRKMDTPADNERKAFEKFEKLEKRLRTVYWNNLGSIYDDLSTDVLLKAKDILEKMQEYHIRGSFSEYNTHNVELWYEQLVELRALLNNPTWVDNPSDPQEYKMPLYYEIDLGYIEDIIERRTNKPRKHYREREQELNDILKEINND